jgi:hypothetical protein
MTVHIDEAFSEVALEPEGQAPDAPAAHGGAPAWQELERFRAIRERARQEAERTRSEAFGD